MFISSVEAYEDLVQHLELAQQQLLAQHNYNSVGNFIKLYEGFKSNQWEISTLKEYYQYYTPPITQEHHTCVGLAFEVIIRSGSLEKRWPGLSDHLSFASCEEAVKNIYGYVVERDANCKQEDPDQWMADKEHVVVFFKFSLNGRKGYAVMDQGYHVARVVTVMEDGQYPHTGEFTQQFENQIQTNYTYSMCPTNKNYIVWTLKSTNQVTGKTDGHTSLIYVGAAFCSPVDVTERRNLVYDFRSLVARDTKGLPVAGLHFKVKFSPTLDFTVFYRVNGEKQKVKIPFNKILVDRADLGLNIYEHEALSVCNKQLNFEPGKLTSMIRSVTHIVRDEKYVSDMLDINEHINELLELDEELMMREE